MSVDVNGIAHIQMTIANSASIPFWESLCHFLEMETLIRSEDTLYCIGSRTGILVRLAPAANRQARFDQDLPGLHHLCFRARSNEDVDTIFAHVETLSGVNVIHGPQADGFAPGYYSILFEDPDGIRIEVNHVPGKGHFGDAGRLGPAGTGPARRLGDDQLVDD